MSRSDSSPDEMLAADPQRAVEGPLGPSFDALRRMTGAAEPSSRLADRVLAALSVRAAARAREERRFMGVSITLAACVALTSLGVAVWQEARFVDGIATTPDVWSDGEHRDP